MSFDITSTRQYASIRGSRMSYLDIGRGPVVVLGHSFLFDARMWVPQIRALGMAYRLVIPEVWGHGGSGAMPAGTNTMQDIANDHLELLDQLKIDRFSLVGHALGGMWCAEITKQVPKRVTSMTLLDCDLGGESIASRARFMAILRMLGEPREPDPILESIMPLFFAPETISRGPAFVTEFKQRVSTMLPEQLSDTVLPLGRLILNRGNATNGLDKLRTPALVMVGELSFSPRPSDVKKLANTLTGLFIKVHGAGHHSTLEKPDEVNSHLAAFLSHAGRRPKSIIHSRPIA